MSTNKYMLTVAIVLLLVVGVISTFFIHTHEEPRAGFYYCFTYDVSGAPIQCPSGNWSTQTTVEPPTVPTVPS